MTEGVAYCTGDTPPGICLKSANASPLIEGAGNGANNNLKRTAKSEFGGLGFRWGKNSGVCRSRPRLGKTLFCNYAQGIIYNHDLHILRIGRCKPLCVFACLFVGNGKDTVCGHIDLRIRGQLAQNDVKLLGIGQIQIRDLSCGYGVSGCSRSGQ